MIIDTRLEYEDAERLVRMYKRVEGIIEGQRAKGQTPIQCSGCNQVVADPSVQEGDRRFLPYHQQIPASHTYCCPCSEKVKE